MKRHNQNIELNEQFKKALDLLEQTDINIFITGKAGTGKSTLLNLFRGSTTKKIVVLAPTGVAAINIKGETIHSFFGFKPDITLSKVKKKDIKDDKNIYKKLDMIVIDEISMVRADLLDCVDKFLRLYGPHKNKPFGAIQMVFIGDLYQLPPVVTSDEKEFFKVSYQTPYFFSAKIFDKFDIEMIELEKIYRQNDTEFIGILNAIRNNTIELEYLDKLNHRYEKNINDDEGYIYLTTTNAMADSINKSKLENLPGKLYTSMADMDGDVPKEYMPTAMQLMYKKNAQIMMLNNDSKRRWVNGTIGKITDVKNDIISIILEHQDKIIDIEPYTWDIFKFVYENGKLNTDVVGSFTQYPFRLSWAITIHKSQGKTFHKVIIDIGKGTFTHGQMYVALSRCVSLEGLILRQKIKKNNIWVDYNVMKFLTKYQYARSDKKMSVKDKINLIKKCIQNKSSLQITYLKANDVKSKRKITPKYVGDLDYKDSIYLGVEAFCHTRKENRVFRIDRILEIEEI